MGKATSDQVTIRISTKTDTPNTLDRKNTTTETFTVTSTEFKTNASIHNSHESASLQSAPSKTILGTELLQSERSYIVEPPKRRSSVGISSFDEPASIPREQSLLEQARKRSSLLHVEEPGSEQTEEQKVQQNPQQNTRQIPTEPTRTDERDYWRHTLSYSNNLPAKDDRPTRNFGLKKNTKKGMVAGVFGICAGLLLGISAYFLFTNASGISKLAGLHTNAAGGQDTTANLGTAAGSSQQQAIATTSQPNSATPLGPGGATGNGTTVFLYQIGMYRDANSANQVVQDLKGKGFSVLKRGNDPVQLIVGAAQAKSGFSDLNQSLKDQSIVYYMKPFVVPNVPASISQVPATTAQQLQKLLQTEWSFVEQLNANGGSTNQSSQSNVSKVTTDIQTGLNQLPASHAEAKTTLSATLQDIKDLVSTDPKQTAQYSYVLAKFYTDFAQGVADLT